MYLHFHSLAAACFLKDPKSNAGLFSYSKCVVFKVTKLHTDTLFEILSIERFWKSVKYNYVYLNPCDTGLELFEGVQRYIEYYHRKKHQTIKMSPNTAYDQSMRNQAA